MIMCCDTHVLLLFLYYNTHPILFPLLIIPYFCIILVGFILLLFLGVILYALACFNCICLSLL